MDITIKFGFRNLKTYCKIRELFGIKIREYSVVRDPTWCWNAKKFLTVHCWKISLLKKRSRHFYKYINIATRFSTSRYHNNNIIKWIIEFASLKKTDVRTCETRVDLQKLIYCMYCQSLWLDIWPLQHPDIRPDISCIRFFDEPDIR